jgi:hypothetical protein
MVTTEDFLRFWAKAIPNLQIHPDDAEALKCNQHSLALDPRRAFMRPVRTAPVVLLTLNGGLMGNGEDARAAQMPFTRESMTRNLGGDAPLPDWKNIGNPPEFPEPGLTAVAPLLRGA